MCVDITSDDHCVHAAIMHYVILNAHHQCISDIKLFYTGSVSHNGPDEVDLHLTIDQRGMAPFQQMKGNMSLMKSNVVLIKDSMVQRHARNGWTKQSITSWTMVCFYHVTVC